MPSSWYVEFFTQVEAAANALLGLMARSETTVQQLEASHPLVADAIRIAQADFPGIASYAHIAEAVLAAAKAGAQVVADASATALDASARANSISGTFAYAGGGVVRVG
jgi:hypothetical protein